MRVWPVFCHAPAGLDSPPPAMCYLAPSNSPRSLQVYLCLATRPWKRRHIGSKSREPPPPPPPEVKREASVGLVGFLQHVASGNLRLIQGIGSIDNPAHIQEGCVESGLGTLNLFTQFTVLLLWGFGFTRGASYMCKVCECYKHVGRLPFVGW
eukprot:1151014-Pelagomonas_calceolata.AAC.1